MDIEILNALTSRKNYDAYSRFVKPTSLSEESWNIFVGMGEWLKHNTTAAEISWPHFSAWFSMIRHAKMPADKLAAHKAILTILASTASAPALLKPLLDGLAKRDYASKIGDVSLKIADGDATLDFDKIEEAIASYHRDIGKIDKLEKHVGGISLEELESVSLPGLQWRLSCLNESLGDLRKGDFIVLGKRPDSGGTTFLAAETTFMAEQLIKDDKYVLWVNNEESGNKVKKRIVQACLGLPTHKLDADLPKAFASYTSIMGRPDRIIVLDKADVHVKDVDQLLEKYDVGLIVCDQLWKFKGFEDAGNEVARQTMLFNWGREVAKKYAPVIAVHQADGNAEGVKWIDMGKLYGSKTGIQGEADAIITIGRLPDTGDLRYFYIPKNKLAGGSGARNGRYEVTIQPEIARFKY